MAHDDARRDTLAAYDVAKVRRLGEYQSLLCYPYFYVSESAATPGQILVLAALAVRSLLTLKMTGL